MQRYSMTNGRIYIRAVADRGKPFRKLDGGFDGDLSIGFWSKDGKTIYFNEGLRATTQLFAIDCEQNEFRQVTKEPASLNVSEDDKSGKILINYSDGATPPAIFVAPSIEQVANKASWVRLTDADRRVRGFALGQQEEITWTSK